MAFLLTILAALILIVVLVLVSAIVFEAYRRRLNNTHVEAPAIFEDPKSLKQVPCPDIFEPAENWRTSYNALILSEYLLTHGPLSVAKEFQDDKDSIMEMGNFQFIDEQRYCRFDWGLCVKNLSDKILKLLKDESFLKQERSRARRLTMGIKGFGSFNQLSSSTDHHDQNLNSYRKSNSQNFSSSKELIITRNAEENINGDYHYLKRKGDGYNFEKDHPFFENHQLGSKESLLSAIM